MNKHFFIWSLVILGLFPLLVSGLETSVISISDCVNLNVELINTTLPVDQGEYSFKDCTQNNYLWNCTCNGNYDLILLTNITTLNTYDFQINYTTKYTTQSTRRGGGGSWKVTNTTPIYIYTSNYTNTTNQTNWTDYLLTPLNLTPPKLEIFNITNNTNPIPIYQNQTYQPPITQPNDTNINPVDGSKFPLGLVIIASIIVIISFILIKVLGFNDKPKKPIITESKPKYNPNWRR
jgi:hypothetical protein